MKRLIASIAVLVVSKIFGYEVKISVVPDLDAIGESVVSRWIYVKDGIPTVAALDALGEIESVSFLVTTPDGKADGFSSELLVKSFEDSVFVDDPCEGWDETPYCRGLIEWSDGRRCVFSMHVSGIQIGNFRFSYSSKDTDGRNAFLNRDLASREGLRGIELDWVFLPELRIEEILAKMKPASWIRDFDTPLNRSTVSHLLGRSVSMVSGPLVWTETEELFISSGGATDRKAVKDFSDGFVVRKSDGRLFNYYLGSDR